MPNPAQIRGDRPKYDDLGRSHYSFNFWTKEANPEKGGVVGDSAHLTIFSFFANWSEMRWGHLSTPWLGIRQAMAGGWAGYERAPLSPENPPEKYFVRGKKLKAMSNFQTKAVTENFIQYAVEEAVYPFDTIKGFFNVHPALGRAEPLHPGNVWALKRALNLASQNAAIMGGQIEKFPNRSMWFNGPPTDNEDTPGDESTYVQNRQKLYSLASNDKAKGRIVEWAIE